MFYLILYRSEFSFLAASNDSRLNYASPMVHISPR